MPCLTGLFSSPSPPPPFGFTGLGVAREANSTCPHLLIYAPALFDFKSFIQRLIFVIIRSAHLITRTMKHLNIYKMLTDSQIRVTDPAIKGHNRVAVGRACTN